MLFLKFVLSRGEILTLSLQLFGFSRQSVTAVSYEYLLMVVVVWFLLWPVKLRSHKARRAAWRGRGQWQRRSPALVGVVTRSVWPRSYIEGSFSSSDNLPLNDYCLHPFFPCVRLVRWMGVGVANGGLRGQSDVDPTLMATSYSFFISLVLVCASPSSVVMLPTITWLLSWCTWTTSRRCSNRTWTSSRSSCRLWTRHASDWRPSSVNELASSTYSATPSPASVFTPD